MVALNIKILLRPSWIELLVNQDPIRGFPIHKTSDRLVKIFIYLNAFSSRVSTENLLILV